MQQTLKPAPQSSPLIRFGMFEADLRSGELRKNGIKIKVQDLPFRALKLFLNHPNEVLSREQFRNTLWPEGVFVDFDHGISSAINRLRDALGDSADNPLFIETVDRRGYRWIAPTSLPMPAVQPVETTAHPAPGQTASILIKSDHEPRGEHGLNGGVGREERQPEDKTRKAEWPAAAAQSPLGTPPRWGWMLIFPMAALALVMWGFRPAFHLANAASRKAPALAQRSLDAAHQGARSEAEEFYLKGRFYWQKRTPDGLNKALDAFTQAIVHDPNYAPAYVGLADCYNLLREYTLMPADEAYPRALAAAKKAVELDPQSSEAHASLAFALFYGMWDATDAGREFRRAIQLDPNNALAHHWYATFLAAVGRNSDSLAEIEQAQLLDPSSKAILADKGDLLWASGRSEEGITLLKQLEAAEPDFISPHRYLKNAYYAAGDYASFLAEWKKEALLMRDTASLKLIDAAGKGYASGGAQGMLHNELDLQRRLYERGSLSPYDLAETNSLLGNKREAFRYLEIAYSKHDDATVQVEADPDFNPLHNDPAYTKLLAQLGILHK